MRTVVTGDGVRLAYRVDGEAEAQPLLFINSLGTDLRMWEPQVACFSSRFQVIRYDTRGHGQSQSPVGPYSIERLGIDTLALLDGLQIERVHLCGLSLGGLTALWIAVHHSERLHSAIFANTAARIGTADGWLARIRAVQSGGMAAVRETVLARYFSPRFRSTNPEAVSAIGDTLVATHAIGYVGACSALCKTDLRPHLSAIRVPSLIVAGTLDESTPPHQSQELHDAIVGSKLVVLRDAAHLSNLEQPEAFNSSVLQFLLEV